MADEITLSMAIGVINGEFSAKVPPVRITRDQTTAGFSAGIQTIGTSAETVVFQTDIATTGYLFLRNLDATNFIEIGPDSAGIVNFIKMLAGDVAMFRFHSSATMKAKADTSACSLEFFLLEL